VFRAGDKVKVGNLPDRCPKTREEYAGKTGEVIYVEPKKGDKKVFVRFDTDSSISIPVWLFDFNEITKEEDL